MQSIDLSTPLSIRSAFLFPLQSRAARQEVVWGALLLCIPIVGWLLATAAVPGYMTHYCHSLDPREVFNPLRALRRVMEGGSGYWHAWLIALAALACSFLGLLALGFGFLISSVWFWQVAGFSFATIFTEKFRLQKGTNQ
jgi:hypothetical protein